MGASVLREEAQAASAWERKEDDAVGPAPAPAMDEGTRREILFATFFIIEKKMHILS